MDRNGNMDDDRQIDRIFLNTIERWTMDEWTFEILQKDGWIARQIESPRRNNTRVIIQK